MNRKRLIAVGGTLVLAVFLAGLIFTAGGQGQARDGSDDLDLAGEACTVIMVGKDASTDGSTMTTHTCDCGICDWTWRHVAAADHKAGSTRKIYPVSQYKTWPPSDGLNSDLYTNGS